MWCGRMRTLNARFGINSRSTDNPTLSWLEVKSMRSAAAAVAAPGFLRSMRRRRGGARFVRTWCICADGPIEVHPCKNVGVVARPGWPTSLARGSIDLRSARTKHGQSFFWPHRVRRLRSRAAKCRSTKCWVRCRRNRPPEGGPGTRDWQAPRSADSSRSAGPTARPR
jgi:hypothetical protein